MKTRIAFIDKLLNIKYNFSPILHNRFILYFFTLIALINVVFLAGVGDVPSLITFVLVGFLTSFFSKNMIVILVLSLTVTHILKYGMGNTYEGMKTADETTDAPTDEPTDETTDKTTDKKKKPTKEEMMKEYEKFKEVQPDIVDGITKIDPLLKKAENFIEKYENYKGISGFSNAMKTDEGKQKIKEALESMRK